MTTMTRALTMLNRAGDTTIVWEPEQDDQMEEIIRRKMAQGVTFFIIEPRLGGRLPPTKSRLQAASDARQHRALAIPDEDMAKFVSDGGGTAVATPDKPVRRSRISKDPKEVAQSESVGVSQMRGG